jgi:hypothetical protein
LALVIRKKLRARDIPGSWDVRLPGDPDAPVTVVITPGAGTGRPSLQSFIGAGKGAFASPQEVDRHIRQQRNSWQE